MASYSTLLLGPSLFNKKHIPYVPLTSKPKPKSKSKAKAKIKMAEHNHSKAVSFKDGGE